jgi:hypothetical protein
VWYVFQLWLFFYCFFLFFCGKQGLVCNLWSGGDVPSDVPDDCIYKGFSLLDRWGGFCLRAAGCVQWSSGAHRRVPASTIGGQYGRSSGFDVRFCTAWPAIISTGTPFQLFIFLITKMMGSFFDAHAQKGWKFVKGIIHAAMLVSNNCWQNISV